jgi:hypothetical protein
MSHQGCLVLKIAPIRILAVRYCLIKNILSFHLFRILTIPVVFRYDHLQDDGQMKSELFGHPALQYFPNCMIGEELRAMMDPLLPFMADYKILLVDGQVRIGPRYGHVSKVE